MTLQSINFKLFVYHMYNIPELLRKKSTKDIKKISYTIKTI